MLVAVIKQFFILGCISFGGPAAHLGYFKKRFVDDLQWLSDKEYAQIVALSQFLPGPGSSQTGFAIGYRMSGIWGGIAAFVAFTSPSVVLMLLLASFGASLSGEPIYQGIIHGLKLLAVVVVADATLGMFRSFCQRKITQTLCALTACACILLPSLLVQMLLLLASAIMGLLLLSEQYTPVPDDVSMSKPKVAKPKMPPLVLFFALLFGLPFVAQLSPELALANYFYSAGSLVFGGGHVVLPMLQNMLAASISNDLFLSGYAAAQAVPGPMFTMATWLGYHSLPQAPVIASLIATLMIFLPGFLLLVGLLNAWQSMAANIRLQGTIAGVNACVTGLLLSALYQPVFISAVGNGLDMVLVLLGFWLLRSLRVPILLLVSLYVLAGAIFT